MCESFPVVVLFKPSRNLTPGAPRSRDVVAA